MKERGNGHHVAMIVGGIAAGIIGSRLLPPLVAGLAAAKRTCGGGDPFEALIEEHQQILRTLDKMAAAPADSKMQRTRQFLMLKRTLAKHATAEEDVVYPILHRETIPGEDSKHLYQEHGDMKVLLFELESQLMNGADWTAAVLRLRDLIRRHAEEEETSVFPELRRRLQEAEQSLVSGQIAREEQMVL